MVTTLQLSKSTKQNRHDQDTTHISHLRRTHGHTLLLYWTRWAWNSLSIAASTCTRFQQNKISGIRCVAFRLTTIAPPPPPPPQKKTILSPCPYAYACAYYTILCACVQSNKPCWPTSHCLPKPFLADSLRSADGAADPPPPTPTTPDLWVS